MLDSDLWLGSLHLAASISGAFTPQLIEIIEELASALAAGLAQASARLSEQRRLEEAEAMRDILAALTRAGDLNQTLEIILVNLRDVIGYDRAGLYLLDEEQRYVLADRSRSGQVGPARSYLTVDPLVAALKEARKPIVIADIQGDLRFNAWPDLQSTRSWLGAPLLAGEEMIGFLSLGSLEPGAYGENDAAMIQAFTRQVSQVLENAWQHEHSHRRSEDLEVLSTLTFAVGMADSRESTLSAIVDQVTRFFGAVRGTFLFPELGESVLAVKFSQDPSLLGLSHPHGKDFMWQVYQRGEAEIIQDIPAFLKHHPQPIYQALLKNMQSAVLIPLRVSEAAVSQVSASFGLLCFTFEKRRRFLQNDLNLFNAIAEIAGTSLHRAVELEALEHQVDLRTQHLSTLYNINAIASEPLELQSILERVLQITLNSMNSHIGGIHLIDPGENALLLVAHQDLPGKLLPHLSTLPLDSEFWRMLVDSDSTLIVTDVQRDHRLPEALRKTTLPGCQAYLGVVIRAKGLPLGLLSLFNESILGYTIEDLTLFTTIADQIGVSVERVRLIWQAEQAAVVEERQRLARELHDSVTQLLYSQVLFAGAGQKALDQGNLVLLRQHLHRLDQAALQALKEMRLLVYELRPSDHLDEGLVSALQRRLDSVEKRTGMNARLVVQGAVNLDESTELALYRIAQEALNNTLKHADATSVTVQIQAIDNRVVMEIIDDGCGFNPEEKGKAGGMGLANMQERTAALGGQLALHAQPGQGTRITVTFQDR
jgi:signal transduction histidine kinase/putative methionine-R-sulfoxide reductase with GAF domain